MSEQKKESTITYRGTQLIRRAMIGPRGGTYYIYQAIEANRTWGYWYPRATDAALCSNATDRVINA